VTEQEVDDHWKVNQRRKQTPDAIFKLEALPAFLYRSESWTIKATEVNRI
jgi:hypothetical protein